MSKNTYPLQTSPSHYQNMKNIIFYISNKISRILCIIYIMNYIARAQHGCLLLVCMNELETHIHIDIANYVKWILIENYTKSSKRANKKTKKMMHFHRREYDYLIDFKILIHSDLWIPHLPMFGEYLGQVGLTSCLARQIRARHLHESLYVVVKPTHKCSRNSLMFCGFIRV